MVKQLLAMWVMALGCSLVAIAAAYGKGDQLVAIFVFFGMGGFILLRYLGYFRFEIFWAEFFFNFGRSQKYSNIRTMRIKDAESLLVDIPSVDRLGDVLEKAAEGIQFKSGNDFFFLKRMVSLVLGLILNPNKIGQVVSWKDPNLTGIILGMMNLLLNFLSAVEIITTVRLCTNSLIKRGS